MQSLTTNIRVLLTNYVEQADGQQLTEHWQKLSGDRVQIQRHDAQMTAISDQPTTSESQAPPGLTLEAISPTMSAHR